MAKKATEKKAVDLQQFLGEIEKLAYESYLERKNDNIPGSELTDWLKAEDQIKKKYKL